MKKRQWWIIVGITATLLVGASIYIKQKAEQKIKKELSKAQIEYKDIAIRLIPSKVQLTDVVYQNDTKTGSAKSITISNISYWNYFINNTIDISEIRLTAPRWEQSLDEKTPESKQTKNSLQKITIDKFIAENANLLFTNAQDTVLKLSNGNLNIKNLATNTKLINQKIPANWDKVNFSFTDLFSHIDKIHKLKIDSFSYKNEDFNVRNLAIIPRYSRTNYVYHIPYEKDLITLKMPEINAHNFQLINPKDSLSISLNILQIDEPNLNLYRDKTVNDNPTLNDLYSKMLRDAPILIHIDSIAINNGYVSYEEKYKKEQAPGKITFTNLQANISKLYNFHSTEKIPDTTIRMKALVFDKSEVNIDWIFNIGNPQDYFNIKGSGQNFSATSINKFLTPAFLIKTEGSIDKFYFNYTGNNDMADGDFHIYYNKFKIKILNKDKHELKIISWLANLFVKNKPESNGHTKTHTENIERDKTKSFWNYFWSCIQESLSQSLTLKSDDKKKTK